jgi:hypothetical protein
MLNKLLFVGFLFCACGRVTAGDPKPKDTPEPGASTADTGTLWWDSDPGDADGDGYTVAQGDCDDTRADVHPGVEKDTCDGVDQDCDGQVDEDFDGDLNEPNNSQATDLGNFSNEAESVAFGYLPDTQDVDYFVFTIREDSLDWFNVETWLYGTPEGAVFTLDLYREEDGWVHLGGDTATGRGSIGLVDFEGTTGWDDSGTYLVAIGATRGGSCAAPYTLHLSFGGW